MLIGVWTLSVSRLVLYSVERWLFDSAFLLKKLELQALKLQKNPDRDIV